MAECAAIPTTGEDRAICEEEPPNMGACVSKPKSPVQQAHTAEELLVARTNHGTEEADEATLTLGEEARSPSDDGTSQPDSEPYRRYKTLTNHGRELLYQYYATSEQRPLDEAIECFQDAVSMNFQGSGDSASALGSLASALLSRFLISGTRADLDKAIDLSLEPQPTHHTDHSLSLNTLSHALLIRFEQDGDRIDVKQAIIHAQATLEMTHTGHPNRSKNFKTLADALWTRFFHIGDRADLDEAISNGEEALELTPPGHPLRDESLHTLALTLARRFVEARDCNDLDTALTYSKHTLELRPRGHHLRDIALINHADNLTIQYKAAGDHTVLENAIILIKESLELRPPGHPYRFKSLTSLAKALSSYFFTSGDRKCLIDAVIHFQGALELTLPGHAFRDASLNNLAGGLVLRFSALGDRSNLDLAIVHIKSALELRQPGNLHRNETLFKLGVALRFRCGQDGDRTDLEESISHFRNVLTSLPPSHHHRAKVFSNLAMALSDRFDLFGDRADLDEAVIKYVTTLELTPPGHPFRHRSLNNVGHILCRRFEQLGHLTDLDKSIEHNQAALELHPPGHPSRGKCLNCLAFSLRTRYQQTGGLIDLDEAVVHQRGALALRAPGPGYGTIVNDLAGTLLARFGHSGNRTDLDEVISYCWRALELRTLGHPYRSLSVSHLADALLTRFRHFGESTDLDEAIIQYQNAVELRPIGHPFRSRSLKGLADTLLIRLESQMSSDEPMPVSGNIQIYQSQILKLLEDATSAITGGAPSTRLEASIAWVDLAELWSDDSAINAYGIALELLQIYLAGSSSLESRHSRLSSTTFGRTRNLAVDGAACALDRGNIKLAVEMLEQGRNMLLMQASHYRTQVNDLEEAHFTLAAEFRLIGAKMEAFAMTSVSSHATQPKAKDPIAAYQNLLDEWNSNLESIRNIEGFSTFLRPTPFVLLQPASNNGPIIMLNHNSRRTDAIIIHSQGSPRLVPLPDATPDFIARLSEKTRQGTGNISFRNMLQDLWRVMIQPISKSLLDDSQLPRGSRIWWCPTGATSRLPLHAAGDYTKPGENIPDLFVSSYTPTLSALLRARPRTSLELSSIPSILVVGQAETPGQTELKSVNLEIENIKAFAEHITILDGPGGTRNSVLQAMTIFPWIHFACHGHVNQSQPFRSNFSLHDGPLTLLEIAKQDLQRADLAFLSACHSAEASRDRPDEVLHLAAGMQFAGFRSVIGTLWAMCDLDGPDISESFYSSLLGKGGKPVAKSSAHALHRAVGELRMRPDVQFSRWVCFVHYGH